jgi:c-di-GMP-specific phosphodiesterase
MKMAVLAEGVETKEQYDFLKTEQCSLIQGDYLSRPLPVSEIPGLSNFPEDVDKGKKPGSVVTNIR